MIDHVYISVSEIEKSLAFYIAALKPLGWREFGTYDAASGPDNVPSLFGLGDAAYAAAIGAGGIDEGKPAERTYFAPGYYAANVADFDANHLEFVRKAWNPSTPGLDVPTA
jgi:catechol 2,3-dioxygenase-like lactoylglutathione lyase family enzyme